MKIEYLIQDHESVSGAFRVMICENDIIIARKTFYGLSEVMANAAKWHLANPSGRVAMEFRGGKVVELA